MMEFSYGNVDSEGTGFGQSFETPVGAPDDASSASGDFGGAPGGEAYAPRPRHPRMAYYEALGQQLMQAIGGPAAAQQQPTQPTSSLTSGYNPNWLGQALAAGSANGAHL